VAAAWIVCILGWLVVFSLPDSFESEATVYVDTTSALRPLLDKLTVGNDVMSRVELVTTALLGRPQLEKVARETDLHLRASTGPEMDQLIFNMRNRIDIENNPRVEPNVYVIRYRDEIAQSAQDVVAAMLNIFVEDSLGANRQDTQNAQSFLRSELEKLQLSLEASDQELADFKKKNVGRMPGEGGDYFVRLQNEMDKLDDTQTSIQLAEQRQAALRQQLSGEKPMLESDVGSQSELDQRIALHQSNLEALELRFTDLHPDVIAVKNILVELRAQKEQQIKDLQEGDGTGIASDNPVFQNIQIELTNVSVELATLRTQESAQQRRIRDLRDLVDVLPQVEAELARLTRDYDVKSTQYQSLLQRMEIAELSESAEQSEDVQFRIIDPPFLPERPISPNRPLFLLGVLVAGLGLGAGIAFLVSQLRPVFQDPVGLREVTGFPVLGSVTVMRTKERKSQRFRELAVFSVSLISLSILCLAALVMNETASSIVRNLVTGGV